ARRVLDRLEQIEALRRGSATPTELLAGVGAVVPEGVGLLRSRGDDGGAQGALEPGREALESGRLTLVASARKRVRMGLARLLRRPSIRSQTAKGPTLATVIAFANQKGGVAKTTSTLNLGVAFGELGLKVLCIDLDPQGNLTMSQGLNPDDIERS